jgi:prepilin-type N-terminal cleavage/methylation domain-containing protein
MMRRSGGFTLFEVLISIAIFLLLAGGIFAAVSAAFTGSSQVVTSQLDTERFDAFQQFVRKLYFSLPADATIELRQRKTGDRGDVVEVLIWPVAGFAQFGVDAKDGLALSAIPDGAGGFKMSIGYFRSEDTPQEREDDIQRTDWLTLLPNVKEIRWRFAPARNPVFVDTWHSENGRPGIAELSLTMKDGGSSVSDYWIPQLQRRTSMAVPDSAQQTAPDQSGAQDQQGTPNVQDGSTDMGGGGSGQ